MLTLKKESVLARIVIITTAVFSFCTAASTPSLIEETVQNGNLVTFRSKRYPSRSIQLYVKALEKKDGKYKDAAVSNVEYGAYVALKEAARPAPYWKMTERADHQFSAAISPSENSFEVFEIWKGGKQVPPTGYRSIREGDDVLFYNVKWKRFIKELADGRTGGTQSRTELPEDELYTVTDISSPILLKAGSRVLLKSKAYPQRTINAFIEIVKKEGSKYQTNTGGQEIEYGDSIVAIKELDRPAPYWKITPTGDHAFASRPQEWEVFEIWTDKKIVPEDPNRLIKEGDAIVFYNIQWKRFVKELPQGRTGGTDSRTELPPDEVYIIEKIY